MAAANGEIPVATVQQVIAAAFPLIPQEQIEQMLAPIIEIAGTQNDNEAKQLAFRLMLQKELSHASYP